MKKTAFIGYLVLFSLVLFASRIGISFGVDEHFCDLREGGGQVPSYAVPVPDPANAPWRNYVQPGFYRKSIEESGENCGNQLIEEARIYEDGLMCSKVAVREHGIRMEEHNGVPMPAPLIERLGQLSPDTLRDLQTIINQGRSLENFSFTPIACEEDATGKVTLKDPAQNCIIKTYKDTCQDGETMLDAKCPGAMPNYFVDSDYIQQRKCSCAGNKCEDETPPPGTPPPAEDDSSTCVPGEGVPCPDGTGGGGGAGEGSGGSGGSGSGRCSPGGGVQCFENGMQICRCGGGDLQTGIGGEEKCEPKYTCNAMPSNTTQWEINCGTDTSGYWIPLEHKSSQCLKPYVPPVPSVEGEKEAALVSCGHLVKDQCSAEHSPCSGIICPSDQVKVTPIFNSNGDFLGNCQVCQ